MVGDKLSHALPSPPPANVHFSGVVILHASFRWAGPIECPVPYCYHEGWCRAPKSITNSQEVVVVGGRHGNGNKAIPARLVAGSKSSGQPSPASPYTVIIVGLFDEID